MSNDEAGILSFLSVRDSATVGPTPAGQRDGHLPTVLPAHVSRLSLVPLESKPETS